MPTDSNVFGPRDFDPEAACQASLAATLSRVRLRRRMRQGTGAAAALLALSAAGWLMLPPPAAPSDPQVAKNPLVIRSTPLTAAQRLVSPSSPERVGRATEAQVAAVRISTPPDAAVPRLGEAEFHGWLTAHELCCIQLAGGPAQVLPLRRQ